MLGTQGAPETIIGVLAGERAGPSELATTEQVPLKVLVDIAGRPMLERVLDVADEAGAGAPVLLAGPADRLGPAAPWLARRAADGRVIMVGAAESPSGSARVLLEAALARGHSGLVMTTGDHPLLTAATLAAFIRDALATDADAVVGLADHAAVRAAFPDSRRTALRFADGARCGCNLFLFRGAPALQVLDFWQRVEGLRKQPHRILGMLGAGLAVRYAAGRLTLDAALERLGRISGARVSAVAVADPDAAVDVDNLADLATVRARWAQRTAADGQDQPPRGSSKQ